MTPASTCWTTSSGRPDFWPSSAARARASRCSATNAGILGIERQHLLGLAHDGLEIALLLGVVDGDAALLAVEQQLHAGQPALELPDPGDGADGVEHVGGHALDVLPLGHREDQPLGRRQRGLDGPQRRRAARRRSAR